MNKYVVKVLFYTGFNHFYDKIIARIDIEASSEDEALQKTKTMYPKATDEMVRGCGIDCIILGKWKENLKYEVLKVS